jgi:small subunit ribosomal protein S8
MVTDPISDFLIRIKNASMIGKESVSLPLSQMKLSIAEILAREGYLSSVDKKDPATGARTLTVALAYKNGKPVITGVKRISKPSRRMYMSVHDIKPIKRGFGLLVLSTPAGVLTGKEAHDKRVGGEALFEIW